MVKEWLAKNDPESLKAQKSGLKSKVVSFNSFSKKYYFFRFVLRNEIRVTFFRMQKNLQQIFTLLMNSMTWWDSNYRTCLPQSSLLSSRFDKTDSTCKIIFDWTSHWACQNLDHHNKWSRSEFSPTCHKFVFWHFNSWRKWFILFFIIWPWHFALRGNTVIFVNIINVSFLTYLKVFCGKWIGFFIRSSSFLEVCDCLTFPYKETLLPLPRVTFWKELSRILIPVEPIWGA